MPRYFERAPAAIFPARLDSYSGKIELIFGPMFSGKTTAVISKVRLASLANHDAVIIKYEDDRRYADGDVVSTHAGVHQASGAIGSGANIRVVSARRLADVAVVESVVGVDEGQFYPDLVAVCEKWASEGRRVIVAALDGDFARRPFGSVCDLVPLCESVRKLHGVCMSCRQRKSAFTQRIGASVALVEIGSQDQYRTVCRQCYHASPSPASPSPTSPASPSPTSPASPSPTSPDDKIHTQMSSSDLAAA